MLFPRIDVIKDIRELNILDVIHVSKTSLTFSYMQTFTLYRFSDKILNES